MNNSTRMVPEHRHRFAEVRILILGICLVIRLCIMSLGHSQMILNIEGWNVDFGAQVNVPRLMLNNTSKYVVVHYIDRLQT